MQTKSSVKARRCRFLADDAGNDARTRMPERGRPRLSDSRGRQISCQPPAEVHLNARSRHCMEYGRDKLSPQGKTDSRGKSPCYLRFTARKRKLNFLKKLFDMTFRSVYTDRIKQLERFRLRAKRRSENVELEKKSQKVIMNIRNAKKTAAK